MVLATAVVEVWKRLTVSLSEVGACVSSEVSSVVLSVAADGVVDAFTVDSVAVESLVLVADTDGVVDAFTTVDPVAPVDGVVVVSVEAGTDGVGVVDLNLLH